MATTAELEFELLQIIHDLGLKSKHVDGRSILAGVSLKRDSGEDFSELEKSRRVESLLDRGLIRVHGHGSESKTRYYITHKSLMYMAEVTARGHDALELGAERFREAGAPTVNHNQSSHTNFNAPVNQVATGNHSTQHSTTVNVDVGQVLLALQKTIEESPDLTPAQKQESKGWLERLQTSLAPVLTSLNISHLLGLL